MERNKNQTGGKEKIRSTRGQQNKTNYFLERMGKKRRINLSVRMTSPQNRRSKEMKLDMLKEMQKISWDYF